jgi:hypothetical protein
MKSSTNKYLTLAPNVILTDELDKVISSIDEYFSAHPETVTSGLRTSEDQLRIIRKYLVAKGLDKKYPEAMTCATKDKHTINDEYVWQKGWSALLNVGVIINPPYGAICLMDYYRRGKNKKGEYIGMSPHTKGQAFDLSGLDSIEIIKKLKNLGKIRGYLEERENNCLHVDI